MQMISLCLVVSKKLPHAVQSYKEEREPSSSQRAEAGSGARAKEPQLGIELGVWSWEPEIWEQSHFFGSLKS